MEQKHQTASSSPPPPEAFPQHPAFHQLLQEQHRQLHMFWNYQRHAMESAAEFKNHQLPLARIKKIMKADEDVRMISAEAPILFAKACELFILELTIRSWLHAEESKRRTLQKNDVAAAITRTEVFDFLVDIVPREEIKEIVGAAPPQTDDSAVGAAGMYGSQPLGVGWWGQEEEEEEEEGGFGGFDGAGMEVREGYGGVGNLAPPAHLPPSDFL